MTRLFSDSQATSLQSCQVQYDLRSVGHLTGGYTLAPRTPKLILRGGKAFGAGIQAYHAAEGVDAALRAIREAVAKDAEDITEQGGVVDLEEEQNLITNCSEILQHYARFHEPLGLSATEHYIRAKVMRGWDYEGYIDGVIERTSGTWLYESKFRKQLSGLDQIMRRRQIWWYAWAYREQHGVAPIGMIFEEILNDNPSPIRFNQDGKPSAVQSCTKMEYIAACRDAKVEPNQRTLDCLGMKRYWRRDEIIFDERGLEMAERQILSAAKQISMFDRGIVYPIHNPEKIRCNGCSFKEICLNPLDEELVDALFTRTTPARLKPAKPRPRRTA